MFTRGFTVSGSSLRLLEIGERGIVVGLKNADDTLTRKLTSMGLLPGTSITVEQRFPRFMVKIGNNQFALDDRMIRAIYVRLLGSHRK